MQTTTTELPTRRSRRAPIAPGLVLWLAMVAATVIPLFLRVQASGLAVTTIAIAIVVGGVLFAFLNADASLRAEVERTEAILDESGKPARSQEQRLS